MNVTDMDELRRLIQAGDMTMDEDGVVDAKPEPPPAPVAAPIAPPRNDELIAAVKSLETAVREDKHDDSQLLSAVQNLEKTMRAKRRTTFEVSRNFEGITRIVAESIIVAESK